METTKPTTAKSPAADKAQTFADDPPPAKDVPDVAPAPEEEAAKTVQYPSMYQPSGHDPYHGMGGSYELDPDTGVRRPVLPK